MIINVVLTQQKMRRSGRITAKRALPEGFVNLDETDQLKKSGRKTSSERKNEEEDNVVQVVAPVQVPTETVPEVVLDKEE